MVKRLIQEAWESLCLHGRPMSTSLYDHLSFEAATEEKSLQTYIQDYQITKHPIRIDVVHFFWLAMGIAYNRFSKESEKYNEIVEFKEYFGERAFFGLLREYIITGTGLKYGKEKPTDLQYYGQSYSDSLNQKKEETQIMHVIGLEKKLG